MGPKALLGLGAMMLARLTTACCASAYNVTKVTTTAHASLSSLTSYNNTIIFTVHDPDPATNATTTCGQTWDSKSSPYPNWLLCDDQSFQWRFGDDTGVVSGYVNQTHFGISIQHVFEDPSMGPFPYDFRDTFGRAQLDKSILTCSGRLKKLRTCGQKRKRVWQVPIYAVIG